MSKVHKGRREREDYKAPLVQQDPLDLGVGVWSTLDGGVAPVPVFQGQH